MSDDNDEVTEPPIKHGAFGHVTYPNGITQEEADRLAREADAERERNSQS